MTCMSSSKKARNQAPADLLETLDTPSRSTISILPKLTWQQNYKKTMQAKYNAKLCIDTYIDV
jgi:hypothetical protein